MPSKYNRHPMEIKAEQDIRNTQIERFKIKEAFEQWLAFHNQSSDKEPTAFEAFRAGWIEKPARFELGDRRMSTFEAEQYADEFENATVAYFKSSTATNSRLFIATKQKLIQALIGVPRNGGEAASE